MPRWLFWPQGVQGFEPVHGELQTIDVARQTRWDARDNQDETGSTRRSVRA